MKAIVQERYGPPAEVLELAEIEKPVPAEGEVLVKVLAAGVAIGDWLVAQGMPYFARPGYGFPKPRHRVAGFEVAGVVEAVGPGVTDLRAGDEVFGSCNGAFAEYVSVPVESVVPKPNNLGFEEAAAVPVSGFAALQALRDAGGIQAGQKVLVIGASGGVGTFAVQIASAFGAEVTGVCSTRNVDLVRELGAEHVVDYTATEIGATGARYDLIVDTAGNRSLSKLRRVLAPKGTLVIVGGSGGSWFMGFGRTVAAMLLSPFVGQRLRPFFSKPNRDDLLALKDLVEAGKLRPVMDRSFRLDALPEAVAYVGERHARGKTVVTV